MKPDFKTAILFSGYNCSKYLDKCLEPWLKLKNELNLLLISAHGYHNHSNIKYENKGWDSLIKLLSKDLDFILHAPGKNHRWLEEQSKNYMMNIANDQMVDLIWLVDGDEFYSEQDIINIFNFINSNKNYDSYTVQYKNYVLEMPYWINDFQKQVIYWTNRNGGIKDFYFDNYIIYNNGLKIEDSVNTITIPRTTVFIEHYTWLASDDRVKEKIHHQNAKYIGRNGEKCAFIYDDINGLRFNENFYVSRGMLVPTIHESLDIFSLDFNLFIDQNKNTIWINKIEKNIDSKFLIYDCNDNLIYETNLLLNNGIDYFIALNNFVFNNEKYIKVEVFDIQNNKKIHCEKLHLNFDKTFLFD